MSSVYQGVGSVQPSSTDSSISSSDGWTTRRRELAAWADRMLANRKDAWGRYKSKRDRESSGETATTAKGRLEIADLERHFTGQDGHTLGLHAIKPDPDGGTSHWGAADIDCHEGDDSDPDVNLQVALVFYNRAIGLGFRPILEDSNGRGGYHIWIIFSRLVPAWLVHWFMKWLVHDWQERGLKKEPEVYPKQAAVNGDGFGNWLRVFGRHHTYDHWSRVYDGYDIWLEGIEAADRILSIGGSDPEWIPDAARKLAESRPVLTLPPAVAYRPPVTASSGTESWFRKKLEGLAETVAKAQPTNPGRHNTLLKVARTCGGYLVGECSASFPGESEVIEVLKAAGLASGLDPNDVVKTIADGLAYGKREPCDWPTDLDRPVNRNGNPAPPTAPPPAPVAGEIKADATKPIVFPKSDIGNAERFAAYHGKDFRFIHKWNKWSAWDSKRWKLDDSGMVGRAAKDTVRKIYNETAETENESERHFMAAWAMKSEERKHVDSMIALAKAELPGKIEELDQDAWLLNTLSGTIDLRTGELRPHRREDFITKLAPVVYDPNAKCPLWEKTLRTIFDGKDAVISFWQRLLGIALTGDCSEQILPIAHGDGSNGKSTILNALLKMLGDDYATKAAPDMLMVKRFEGHPTERAKLHGKRLVVAIETGEDAHINEPLIKELTGTDKISARRMREDFWDFYPTHKIILCTNHKPIVRGIDWAIWRRLKLIPFTVKIPDADQDKNLPSKLEAEYPGILAWCVRGCLAWQKDGLNPPEDVIIATDEYRAEQDWLEAFLTEECNVADIKIKNEVCCAGDPLYQRYRSWAERRGESPRTGVLFFRAIKSKGFEKKKSSKSMYIGLMLKPENYDESHVR